MFMKFLPSILPVIALGATVFSPQIQGLEVHHPAISMLLMTISSILNHWLTPPNVVKP